MRRRSWRWVGAAVGAVVARWHAQADALLAPWRHGWCGGCARWRAQVDVHVGTLSKAVGSLGGFVATSRQVKQLLVNTVRPGGRLGAHILLHAVWGL